MAISLLTNAAALTAQQSVNKAAAEVLRTQQQLATGLRLVDASDSPSGYYLAANLSANVTQYGQTGQNIATAATLGGIIMSACDNEIGILNVCMGLALSAMNEATNDTNTYTALNSAYQGALQSLTNVANTTLYNGINLANTVSTLTFQTGINTSVVSSSNIVTLNTQDITSTGLGLNTTDLNNLTDANTAYTALKTALNTVANYASSAGGFVNITAALGNNNTAIQDNTEIALGALQDVDYAVSTTALVQDQVKQQVAINVLSTASQSSAMILQLLGK